MPEAAATFSTESVKRPSMSTLMWTAWCLAQRMQSVAHDRTQRLMSRVICRCIGRSASSVGESEQSSRVNSHTMSMRSSGVPETGVGLGCSCKRFFATRLFMVLSILTA